MELQLSEFRHTNRPTDRPTDGLGNTSSAKHPPGPIKWLSNNFHFKSQEEISITYWIRANNMKVSEISVSLNLEKSCFSKTYHRGKSYEWILKIQKPLNAQINFGKSHLNHLSHLTRKKVQHSKGRWCIENAFGFLKGRFRTFKYTINAQLPKATTIIMATCVLHDICLRDANDA